MIFKHLQSTSDNLNTCGTSVKETISQEKYEKKKIQLWSGNLWKL